LVSSEVCPGAKLAEELERRLDEPQVEFIDVHNARQGCFAFRVR
jgi:hypothetical protein